jgi:hypothetical protein
MKNLLIVHRSSFIVHRAVDGVSQATWSFAASPSLPDHAIAFRAGST